MTCRRYYGRVIFRTLPIVCFALALGAQDRTAPVAVREDTMTLPTYDEGLPDPNPQFDSFYRDVFPNYPYPIRTPVNKNRSMAKWRVLVLENEYLSCRVLPDLGGHLYGCTDRLTNKEIFFANRAIRRSSESTRGAFIATGIESNFPFAHSRVGSSPVDFAWSVDGGVGRVMVEDTDRTSGMTWRVEFILRPGSALLEQRVTLYNSSATRRGYHWWANAAVEQDDPHLRIVYPVKWMLPHGEGTMTQWPISEAGVDLSDVANHKAAIGLFAHGSREPWMAIYKPKFRSGVAHYADPAQVRGKKIWLWGSADKYVRENLTEKSNSYVEMQAGEFETQPEFAFLLPGETKTFSHYWIPFRDLGGISRATRDAVLNLSRKGQTATVELNATHIMSGAKIRLSDGLKTVFEATVDLDPKVKYAKALDAAPPKLTVDVIDSKGAVLLHHIEGEYDSLPFDKNGQNPEPVPPAGNSDSEAASLERGAYNEQRDQWFFAWRDYEAGLIRTPRSEKLKLAEGRAAFAVKRYNDAIRYLEGLAGSNAEAAWYFGMALSSKSLRIADAQAALNRASQDPAYAVAARLQSALLAAREKGEAGMAEAVSTLQTLGAQPGTPAWIGGFEVAMLRRTNQLDEASKRLAFWIAQDPANNLLRVERSLLGGADDPTLWSHLGADAERVLNVAEAYRQMGDWTDALKLLERRYPDVPVNEMEPGSYRPQDYALLVYYRGYCKLKSGADPKPDFQLATSLSPLYVFPHRGIDFSVLEAALAKNENDAFAHALLGDLNFDSLLLYEAIAEWKKAWALRRDLPALARNLGRVLLDFMNDRASATPILMEGRRLNPADADIAGLLKRLNGPEPTPPPATSSVGVVAVPKGDLADRALVRSATDPDGASAQFSAANFPSEKQPESVRRAYIEVQLQRLLGRAYAGRCKESVAGLDTLGNEDTSVPFTLYGFDTFMKAVHFQYYIGVIENMCGEAKAAQKRWKKLAKSKESIESVNFIFPLLAAKNAGEPDARTKIDAAILSLKSAAAGKSPALLAFAQGALLLAAGKKEEGEALLQKAILDGDSMVQYLSLTELAVGSRKK